jgi:anti-sigma regulatory factor (Ser/Thr protein kinase)
MAVTAASGDAAQARGMTACTAAAQAAAAHAAAARARDMTAQAAAPAVLGRLTMPGRPDHVSEARALVVKALGDLHPRLDDAVLMVSELVTNSIVHSNSRQPGGTVTVTVLESADGVQVEVADCGSELTTPVVRADRYAAGHGLFLVQSLADQWGYRRDEAGTTVWFRLAHPWPDGRP